jgi:uncharacterized protein YdeI (YjbR/CyaY-like superfamily)
MAGFMDGPRGCVKRRAGSMAAADFCWRKRGWLLLWFINAHYVSVGVMTLETRAGLPIIAFKNKKAFDAWLAAPSSDTNGFWLKLTKKDSRKTSIGKADAIDVALCHGWIDGQLNPYDDGHWLIRFTPRTRNSKWSEKNRTRALELIAEKRMRPAGLAQVKAAQADGRWQRAYAPASTAAVPADLRKALNANAKANAFFATLSGVNRYAILYKIGAVKKAETRARKITEFVAMLARHETIHK